MKRLFEEKAHAAIYSQYRPKYPKEIYEKIITFMRGSSKQDPLFKLALDVGCGSGQLTKNLSQHFEQVIGTDISESQIHFALENNREANIKYICHPAENSSFLEDGSVDLVTCAQAVHWFNRPVFYKEVNRVLRYGGVLAQLSYGVAGMDNAEAVVALKKFYFEHLNGFWDAERDHVNELYKRIPNPFPGERSTEYSIVQKMPLSAFMGYLGTCSGYRKLTAQNPRNTILENLQRDFQTCYKGFGDDNIDVTITWPVVIILGKKIHCPDGSE